MTNAFFTIHHTGDFTVGGTDTMVKGFDMIVEIKEVEGTGFA